MLDRLVRAAVVAALAGPAMLLLAPGPAAMARDKNVCPGVVPPGTTFDGGLLVPSGASCTLNQDTVNGGMDVVGGRFDIHNSVIHGGLDINNLAQANNLVCGSVIDGGTTAENISSFANLAYGESNGFYGNCPGNRIDGDTDIVNNPNANNIELDHNLIHGKFEWLNTMMFFGEYEGNTLTGKAVCQSAPPVINDGDGGPNSYTGPDQGCPA